METRRGLLLGAAAYAMWGLFPLYWPLLEPGGAVEILGHRILWSAVFMVLLVLVAGYRPRIVALLHDRRATGLLLTAAVVITFNWGTYIWGVNNHHVVETSLGYFINPLVTVLMGVLLLGETLRALQWLAVAVASAAVVVLAVDSGRPPWIALALALSFGTYGLLKKQANAGAVESLTLETVALAPLAFGFLVVNSARGDGHFLGHGLGHAVLLIGTGVVTALPLICFGGSATRIPFTMLGLLQYIAPVLQFLIGVAVRGEQMSTGRWAGFALVWLALALFTVESLRHHRRTLAAAELA
ncbi:MAG: EamA family transporter RarD [Nocardioidaceae bacterium]